MALSKRRLIIEGNAVYELDEDCMLRKKIEEKKDANQKTEVKEIERYRNDHSNRYE